MRVVVAIFGLAMLVGATGCTSQCSTLSRTNLWLHNQRNGKVVLYHVVRTNSLNTDKLIQVRVGGLVNHPGVVELPEGSSALEAIAQAGSFARFSYRKRITVFRDGWDYDLILQQRGWLKHHSHAWYEIGLEYHKDDHWATSQHGSDFLLRNGDQIGVSHGPIKY